MKLNSDLQPKVKINAPAFKPVNDFKRDFDLTDVFLFEKGQPFEQFKNLRNNSPVHFHEAGIGDSEPGFWVLTKYTDIEYVSRNQKIFSSQLASGTTLTLGYSQEVSIDQLFKSALDHMLGMDDKLHLSMRNPHMKFFTPKYVEELRKKVSIKVTELLDKIAPMGQCNLVDTVSSELPIFSLSEILGVPEEDRPKIKEWMTFLEMAQVVGATQAAEKNNIKLDDDQQASAPDPAMIAMFTSIVNEMFQYGRDILLKRRKDPKDDLLSVIANIEIDGEKLPEEYLDGSWLLIIIAGNETTRNSISGTIKLLTENPDQKEKLINNMELLPNMVNEAIRLISPVIYMRRTTTEETQVGEQKIGPQEKVVLYYGAANRDPDIFINPDKFDIDRDNAKKHLAFGYGRHLCLGKHMANMQLSEVYKQILERFPDMHQSDEWKVVPNNFTHSISEMPVAFKPE
jgi:cytochrome P450|tara:strand:- start:2447 stop:3814 length:1368 start_codon:yes stop_codon:yes gene_type:complete